MAQPHHSQLLSAGDVVDGVYVVERFLAGGGMGQVYLARDQRLERTVALKLLHPDQATEVGQARFRREAQALSCVVHPNVVSVYGFGSHGEVWYLAMEYVVGRPLDAELSARGALPLEEAVTLVRQVASGLAEAHAAGLVHRDIKPGNLLLRDTASGARVVKVVDFGLARDVMRDREQISVRKQILGTPAYMAPEQILADEVDGRADLYALGVLAYELLTGRLPFVADTMQKVMLAHLHEPAPPLYDGAHGGAGASPWSAELEDVVARALAKRPEDRFATVTAFADAFAAAAGADSSLRVVSHATCPTCGIDDARAGGYCHRCGGATPMTRCGVCGTRRSGERYVCVGCGASLLAPSRRNEKSAARGLVASGGGLDQATVLALVARGPALQGARPNAALVAGFHAVVERAGGRSVAALGDELVAVFGAGGMRDNEVALALDAALEIAGLHGGSEAAEAAALAVGVDEGASWTQGAGHAYGTAVALGDAVASARAAARLGGAGEVCAGDRALAAVRARYATASLAPRVRRVLGPAVLERGFGVAAGRRAGVELVGRRFEFATLASAVERALREGRLVAVPVLGPSGVGKTRLVSEAMAALPLADAGAAPVDGAGADAARWRVLHGRCTSSGHVAYEPFVEVLRSLIEADAAEGEPLDQQVRRLPGVIDTALHPAQVSNRSAALTRVLAPRVEAGAPTPSEPVERSALFEAVVACVVALTDAGPVALVIDDVHWARSSTLDLLSHLFARVDDRRVVVILTARNEGGEVLDGLKLPASRTVSLDLAPLDDDAGAALARALLAPAEVPPRLLEQLHRFADGRPGLVEEAVDALFAEGVVEHVDGKVVVHGERVGDLDALDRSFDDIVLRRVGRLPPAERELLWAVALAGETAPMGMISAIVGRDVHPNELGAASRAGYLLRDPRPPYAGQACYRFRQSRVADLLARSVADGLAQRLHERAAAWLRAWRGPRPAGFGAALAHHAVGAGDRKDAVELLVQSAREALFAFDNRGAFDAYGVALEVARDQREAREVRAAGADGDGAREADAAAHAEAADALLIEAAIGRATVGSAVGEHEAAVAAADVALAIADESQRQLRARALLARANAQRLASAFERALADARAAVEIAGGGDGSAVAIEATGLIAGVELHRGRHEQAEAAAQRAVAWSAGVAEAVQAAATLAPSFGEAPTRRESDELSNERGATLRGRIRALNILGHIAARAKRYDDAVARYSEARALCDAAAAPVFANMLDTALGNLAYRRGQLDEAARIYGAAIVGSENLDDRYGAAVARTNLGHVLVDGERHAEAVVHLRRAEEVFRQLKADDNLAEVLRLLGAALVARGELQGARAAANESVSLARHLGNVALAEASAALVRRADTIQAEIAGTTALQIDAPEPSAPAAAGDDAEG